MGFILQMIGFFVFEKFAIRELLYLCNQIYCDGKNSCEKYFTDLLGKTS